MSLPGWRGTASYPLPLLSFRPCRRSRMALIRGKLKSASIATFTPTLEKAPKYSENETSTIEPSGQSHQQNCQEFRVISSNGKPSGKEKGGAPTNHESAIDCALKLRENVLAHAQDTETKERKEYACKHKESGNNGEPCHQQLAAHSLILSSSDGRTSRSTRKSAFLGHDRQQLVAYSRSGHR